MSTKQVKEKYKDPKWQQKRLKVFERDNWTCFRCGAKDKPLHVHHKKYSGAIHNSLDGDMQTLCEDCHNDLGKHPKGGIWWIDGGGFSYSHCPMCGSKDTKEKGSYDKCLDCGHRIVPDIWD